MIEVMQDDRYIGQILELARERLPEHWQVLSSLLHSAIGSENDLVLVEVGDRGVAGFLAASFCLWQGEPAVIVQSFAVDRSIDRESKKMFGLLLDEWAVAKGVRKILGLTIANPRIFSRYYGYQHIGSIVMREVSVATPHEDTVQVQ